MKHISVVGAEIRSGHVPETNRVLLLGTACFFSFFITTLLFLLSSHVPLFWRLFLTLFVPFLVCTNGFKVFYFFRLPPFPVTFFSSLRLYARKNNPNFI